MNDQDRSRQQGGHHDDSNRQRQQQEQHGDTLRQQGDPSRHGEDDVSGGQMTGGEEHKSQR